MKYAKIERERRFLLKQLPPDLSTTAPYHRIIDRYLLGTRLRLRRIEQADGTVVSLKFTQKYLPEDGNAAHTIITNIYLNEIEYARLATLEAKVLTKGRYSYQWEGQSWSIDCFDGSLSGLILAEKEFASDETMAELTLPSFALTEVTDDPFFTGGHLVTLSDEALQQVLRQRNVNQ